MTELEQIERKVLELHGGLDLRPSLERAADLGDLLLAARKLVKHGDWLNWLARVGLKTRTAWDYIAVARERDTGKWWPSTTLAIKRFLEVVRRARKNQQAHERAQARSDARRVQGLLDEDIVLANADCREYAWPRPVDLAVIDAPWHDLDCYRWAARWAAEHLRERGIALVQACQNNLPDVLAILGGHLTYRWTLSFLFGFGGRPNVRPWKYFLNKLARPGALVCDPFAGSAVIGVVCKELGLRYIGTEIDRGHYEVARGRLATHGQRGS